MNFCIIASGPSLTKEDCDLIETTNWKTITTNDSWRLAPFADILFACDTSWWNKYYNDVKQGYKGECWTSSQRAKDLYKDLKYTASSLSIGLNTNGRLTVGNSGFQSINLAYNLGAKRIFLLGFDCKADSQKRHHWFGQHPDGLSKKQNFSKWKEDFCEIAKDLKKQNIEVFNITRDSALNCFPKITVEQAITTY